MYKSSGGCQVGIPHHTTVVYPAARLLDDKLTAIAQLHALPEHLVRTACALHRKPSTSPAYWQGWNQLRSKMKEKFHAVFDAVVLSMAQTPRSSSMVKNLNSRLRIYFTLRRELGGSYLSLLQFFLNLLTLQIHQQLQVFRSIGGVLYIQE